jgi:enterochelin esterase-like enzyme
MKGFFTTLLIIISSCLLFSCNPADNQLSEQVDAPIIQKVNATESQVATETFFSKSLLYEALVAEHIDAQWHPSPDGHSYSYWIGQLDNYLLFYSGK